jgi:hypothetical protein
LQLISCGRWNEWLTFNLKYKELPLSAQLVITIWRAPLTPEEAAGSSQIPLGGTTVSLFGKKRCAVRDTLLSTDNRSLQTAPERPPEAHVGVLF